MAADWRHAWSLLGQWSGWVTFPVPEADVWPRHGHLRGILDGYQGRQPNFHKWARPAYEQGALPTLSLLSGDVAIRVLPGDKIYQAMTLTKSGAIASSTHLPGIPPSWRKEGIALRIHCCTSGSRYFSLLAIRRTQR